MPEENSKKERNEEIVKEAEKLEYIKEEEEKISPLEKKIKGLKEKLENCKKEKTKYLNGWQRERAAFINYKKEESARILKEAEIRKEDIFKKLILLTDNFDQALQELPIELKNHSWIQGVFQIQAELKNILKNEGIRAIEVKVGGDFNPEIHEAIEIGEGKEGKILEVIQEGYFWQDKILRPAKVKVGKITR